MPSLIGSLFVSLTADFAPFQRNMKSAEGVVASTSTSMRRSMGLTEKSVTGMQRSMNQGIKPYALISAARTFDTVQQRANLLRGSLFAVTAAFGGLGAALTTNVVSRYLDTFTGLENQMRVVSKSSANLAGNMAAVQGVSERSRASLAAVATLYSRIAKAAPNEAPMAILRRVETINKALQLGGATAQEAASAAIQFSQAIASNRLGGEELRAVLETPLGLELAKGMGITIGKFRELATEGKLTSEVLFKSLDRISGAIDGQFANSISTIDQALTVVDGKITAYAGHLDDAYGITRLITGSIYAFGNNLETIVPLLAQVGLGLGALYAARRAGGLAGAAGAPVRALLEMKAARVENVRLAREEVAIAKKFADAQAQNVGKARGTVAGDVSSMASKATLKQYQRDLFAVQKADADHLKLIDAKNRATVALGEIYKTTSVGEMKAAQALADQQEKLNAAMQRQVLIRREVKKADTAVTGGAGLSSQTGGSLRTQTDAQKALNAVKKEQLAIDRQVVSETTALEQRRAAILRENNASFLKAANQRAAVIVQEKALTQQLVASEQRRSTLVGTLSGTRGRITKEGGTFAAAELREAESAALGATRAYERASSNLNMMQKAASTSAIAIRGLGAGIASLTAFLGGPWGVALLAGVGILTLWGESAARAAAEEKKFQDILKERVGQAAAEGNNEAILSQLSAQQYELLSQLDTVRAGYDRITASLTGWLDGMNEIERASNNGIAQFRVFFDQFRAGNVSFDELIENARTLRGAMPDKMFNGLIKSLEDMRKGVSDSSISLNEIQAELDQLDGTIAKVRVEVDVIDPSGLLRREGIDLNAPSVGDQYKQYGAGRQAAETLTRRAVGRRQFEEDIMGAAGDTGDKALNTATKVKRRAEAILKEGEALGYTRAEAEKLAKQELDLAEKTRLAAKEGNSAAKEYETFAKKLAELGEQGAGAFMSDLDRKVLEIAKSLKDGSKLMADYTRAVQSGDLSSAPPELLQAREALMQIGAADTWRDIIQQYGKGAQVAGQFADKQAELNYLVASGRITAEQATTAYTDFVTSFGQYEWINSTSSALTEFANSAIEDFSTIEDAFKSLMKNLLKIATEELITKPLEQNFRNFLTAIVSGGQMNGRAAGGLGVVASLFGGAGKSAPTAQAKSAGSQIGMSAYRAAAKTVESSGGNYSALGPMTKGDRAYGAYQVMGNNIPSWTKEALGKSLTPTQFLGDAGAQDSVFDHFFGKSLAKYGNPQDAASVWFSGRPMSKAGGASDVLGTTVPKYVEKFNAALDSSAGKLDGFGTSITKSVSTLMQGLPAFGSAASWSMLGSSSFAPTKSGFADMLGITGGGGGSGGGGFFSSLLGGLGSIFSLFFHGGGKVGSGGVGRMMPAGAFAGAPRLHSGLKSDEFSAILQKGERVLTARDEAKTMNTMAGLSRRAAGGVGKPGLTVHAPISLDGAISGKDVVNMVQGAVNTAVEQSKRQFPSWNIEYQQNGAFS